MILRKEINYIIGSGHLRYDESWSKDMFLYLEDGFLIGGQVLWLEDKRLCRRVKL
jgi:hypothetical protein